MTVSTKVTARGGKPRVNWRVIAEPSQAAITELGCSEVSVRKSVIGGGLAALVLSSAAFGAPQHKAKAPPVTAAATPSPEEKAFCEVTTSAITSALKGAAEADLSGRTDDSAIRGTMYAGQQSNEMSQVRENMQQLRDHKCTPYPYPVSSKLFAGDAAMCKLALMNQAMTAEAAKSEIAAFGSTNKKPITEVPECERANWKPSLKGVAGEG